MAKKITSIKLRNYRAWDGEYDAIELPKGENLLIYGENGSGKSSLFLGLRNFFRSSLNGVPAFDFNKFATNRGEGIGSIQLTFTDNALNPVVTEQYDYAVGIPSNNTVPFIRDTRKLNSFLDYRSLLAIHYAGSVENDTPNLFNAIVEDLLRNYRIDSVGEEIHTTNSWIENGLRSHGNSIHYAEANEYIPEYRQLLFQVLGEIRIEANRLLHEYFQNNIDIVISEFTYEEYRRTLKKVLKLQINYFGETFRNYNSALNEARLSSLAICICFAAVLSHPPSATEYKILVLDDIFIGLDYSNRLPLLKLLKTEFSDYQIIITTYDRNWFELAKSQLMPSKWKLFELFHEEIITTDLAGDTISYEKPVIIDANFDYLTKAKQYFKSKDYPACANYLRKEIERIIRGALPLHWRITEDDQFGTKDITDLETLLIKIEKWFKDSNVSLPAPVFDAIRLYRKLVLNPQSHDDVSSPIFRGELTSAFDVVQGLGAIGLISKQLLIPMRTRFSYNDPATNYVAEIELADNIERITFGAITSLSHYKFRVLYWKWNEVDYVKNKAGEIMTGEEKIKFCDQKRTLKSIFSSIRSITDAPELANLEQEFFVSGRSLQDLIRL